MGKYGEHVKVWKKTYGSIPKDPWGRSYEIHHIDGNSSNNCLENLICVSINEHYDIHKKQGDWGAAFLIARRMESLPDDISQVARNATLKRIEEGTHNFLDPNFPKNPYANRGYVVALDTRTNKNVRIKKSEFEESDFYVGVNKGRKHTVVHTNRGHNKGKKWKQSEKRQNIIMCPHCSKSGDASGLKRWHFDNCKLKELKNE
jgi:hypothetical protein